MNDSRSAQRRDPDFYQFAASVETRFQDLDPLGHINNVAMAALFEQGRVRFNRFILDAASLRGTGDRWLIAKIDINYLAEAHFPAPLRVYSGIGRIGNSSWTILSAGFQDDAHGHSMCVATCDCVLVMTGAAGPKPISDALRATLIQQMCAA